MLINNPDIKLPLLVSPVFNLFKLDLSLVILIMGHAVLIEEFVKSVKYAKYICAYK